jgi:iron complex transport system substrate-binding protein
MATSHGPCRIASLQPSATVILHAIGQLDRVAACTRYCADIVPDVADGSRTILADSWTANAAQIIAAKPDLIIASVPYQEKSVIEILKAGVPFLGLSPKNLEDIYRDIAMIAGIVGVQARGEEIIREMKQHIESVRTPSATSSRPRVYCEEWGKPLIISQKWVAELVEAAGGEFIGTPGHHVAPEVIAAADPEVIIAAWCGAGDRVPLERIIRERAWQQTSAARNGRVFCVRDEFLNTPAPTLLRGLEALAFAIHPELFPRTKGIRAITDVPTSTMLNTAS